MELEIPIEIPSPTQQWLDFLPDAALIVDRAGRMVMVNGRTQELFGYRPEDLLHQPLEILVPERFRTEHAGHQRSFFDNPRARPMGAGLDLRGRRKDGSEFPAEISISPMQAQGQALAWALVRDVTEQRRTETALREREARLDLIFNSSSDMQMLFRSEPDGGFVTEALNRAFISITRTTLGTDVTDCIGKDFAALYAATGLPAEEIERRRLLYRKVLRERVPLFYHSPQMGTREAAEISVSPVVNQDGSCTHVFCIGRIETARVKAEAELRESQARLQLIFDSTSDLQVLFRAEPGGRFIVEMVNRAMSESFAALVGLNAAQFLGQELEEFLKPVEFTAEEREFRRSMCQKAALEKTVVHYTGSQGPRRNEVEVSLSPVLDRNGECTHVFWNARVVNDRVRAEAELRDREERLRMVFNSHQDLQSLIRIEPDGRFVNEAFNQAYLDFAGRSIPDPNEFLERGRDEFLRALGIPENEIERALAYWREVAANKTPARSEITYTFDAGQRQEIGDITIVPVLNRDGVCTHLLWTGHFITERKRAEEELRKRERELEEAQSIGHIGSWTWDVPKDKLVWSDEVYRILGYEPQQFPPIPLPGFLEMVHPDDREKVERAAWAAFEARTGHDIEHRIVRPDGTVRFVHTRSRIQVDTTGQPLRLSATIHDVTEERQATAREAARLRRLKQLSELSMMLAGDPATVFERVVRMIGELFEVRVVRLAEIVGHDLSYRAVYAGGKVLSNAGRCPLEIAPCGTVAACKDIRIHERVQELFPRATYLRDYDAYSWCGFPSLDNEGNVVAVTSLVDDKPREFTEEDRQILRVIGQRISTEFERGKSMAERARMEEELRQNERRLEEAQHMAHLGSWYSPDALGGEMKWSPELYRIYEIDPALGSPNLEVVLARTHPDDKALVHKTHDDLMGEIGHFESEHRLLMADGRIKYVLVQGSVGTGADGRTQMGGTVQDITERKRAEQEREKLHAQLAQAQKMESIGRLAGGVAHDFNNMLTVILGYAAMSRASLAPDAKQHRHMTEIIKAANRSKEITQKLLGFSRRQIIAPILSNLNALVADLQEPLARLIGEDIELAFHPSADLWKVVVDHSQVNQILLNLVVNARDAMPRGGKLTIETENVSLSEEYCRHHPGAMPGRHVLLAVSDTGVGMNEETLSHIFEPFFTTKDRDKGTGLGLATVYGVVKQNGGFVNVYTEPAHGTTFKIYFPPMAGEADANEISVVPQAMPAGHGTILLVEDDELVREITKATLESIGYTPLVAATPEQAIELCSRAGSDIRLMLTDVVMPGMNGMELRERVRALNPGMRVLFMSGYTPNVIVSHGVLKRGVHFIQKPFTIEDLAKRLEEVLAADPLQKGK